MQTVFEDENWKIEKHPRETQLKITCKSLNPLPAFTLTRLAHSIVVSPEYLSRISLKNIHIVGEV